MKGTKKMNECVFLSSLQPDMYPGNCWAFKGSQGYLVIRLSLSVIPTSFCLEHIPKSLSPSGNITSAPRRFSVYVRMHAYVWFMSMCSHIFLAGCLNKCVFVLRSGVQSRVACRKSCCLFLQGLDDEYQEEGKLLGDYTYQEDGESLQIFPVMVKFAVV